MNNAYYNERRTWRCLVLNPSARTQAEPHNFLLLKLLLKNSNAELLEIQKDRHLEIVVPVLTSTVEIPSLPGILAALGIAPGCGDALGSLRAPARAAPAMLAGRKPEIGTPNAAPNAQKRSKWENPGSCFLQNQ